MSAAEAGSVTISSGPPSALRAHLARAAGTPAYRGAPRGGEQSLDGWPVTPAGQVESAPSSFQLPVAAGGPRFASSGSTGEPTVVYRSWSEVSSNARGVADRLEGLLPCTERRLAPLPESRPVRRSRAARGRRGERRRRARPAVALHRHWYRLAPIRPGDRRVLTDRGGGAPEVLLDVERGLTDVGTLAEVREQVATVLTIGSTCTPAMRRRLARSWHSWVTDFSFGGTGAGTVATGCRLGNLHTMTGRGIHEVLRDDGSVVPLAAVVRGNLVLLEGQVVTCFAGTPSDHRSWSNSMAALRRLGFTL